MGSSKPILPWWRASRKGVACWLGAFGRDGIDALDDEELAQALAAAVRGDAAAFAVLWHALQPALLRYLRVIVGEAAEDVASETWLQAARDLRAFAGEPPAFRVWLFRIARHRAIDERRRARRRPEEPQDLIDQDFAGSAPDAAAEVIQRSDTDWALSVIASLPKDQAEAVTLRVVAGLDVAQTAQVLGKRPGAVRIAAMRGLRRLAGHSEVKARRAAIRPSLGLPSARPEGV
ncbi:RNA polymerase sigma factor [Micromonospora sp. CPCC 205371]|nr:RNA polymerase sigma factor [Micromonospora sp. CPCC 205371]